MLTTQPISHPPARNLTLADGSFVSLVDVLRRRAEHQPDEIAFRFLRQGEQETSALSYAQLDRNARRLAARLQAADLTGARVLLLYPTGPENLIAILACLYAGVVAVPLALPRPNRSETLLEAIARCVQPKAVLTTLEVTERHDGALQRWMTPGEISILATDVDDGTPRTWSQPLIEADSPAYLQFTSGSTSDPKGIEITHGNLFHNCSALAELVSESGPHVGVGWLPLSHDMGLVGTIFLPVWLGFPHVFMPPEAFMMKPIRWLQAISRYQATLSPAPNFAYDLCVQRVRSDQRKTLDLTSWCIAFNGAERVCAHTIENFTNHFSGCGFRPETFLPCYGLAEATLYVTGAAPGERPLVRTFDPSLLAAGTASVVDCGIPLVSCGQPHRGVELIVVDPETGNQLADQQVGEIWISGPSVAAGYWNDPSRTLATFRALTTASTGASFLRTGDLGFLWDGELFVTGRLKDLIIIGGRNVAPDDIETAAEAAHPAIGTGGVMALSVEGNPRERLIVLVEVDRHHARSEQCDSINQAVREAVTMHCDIAIDEIVLVHRRSLPRTRNGKKQRSLGRQAFVDGAIRGRIDE